MSERVCYLSSTDRGDRLATVRLVGARSEDQWRATGSADPLSVLSDVASAGGWIQERTRGSERDSGVSLLCVDVEGANCTWLTAPSTDATVVAAALAHSGDGASARIGSAWAAPSLSEASVEALAGSSRPSGSEKSGSGRGLALRRGTPAQSNGHASPQRLAVLAIPDVSARLLLDSLDERSVPVERVVSLWHALATAWDPAARSAGSSKEGEVVATSAPVTGIVMIDPAGRLVWAWSRGGELLAAGTIRLPQDRHEMGTGVVRIGRSEVGRLTTDWLSWSVQLGIAPARIICLAPAIGTEEDLEDLTPAQIGSALGTAWPGASVDMAVQDDPIGATLSRLVDSAAPHCDDARRELTLLTHRPGRAHRTLYLWAAGCLLAISLTMGAIGWKARGTASESVAAAENARGQVQELIAGVAPPASSRDRMEAATHPRRYMEEQLRAKQQAAQPDIDPPRPILAELETLSYVLGTREVEIEELSFIMRGVDAWIRVPDTATAELLLASLDGIADTHCRWQGRFPPPQRATGGRGGQPDWRHPTRYHLAGEWRQPRDTRTSAATGGRP